MIPVGAIITHLLLWHFDYIFHYSLWSNVSLFWPHIPYVLFLMLSIDQVILIISLNNVGAIICIIYMILYILYFVSHIIYLLSHFDHIFNWCWCSNLYSISDPIYYILYFSYHVLYWYLIHHFSIFHHYISHLHFYCISCIILYNVFSTMWRLNENKLSLAVTHCRVLSNFMHSYLTLWLIITR